MQNVIVNEVAEFKNHLLKMIEGKNFITLSSCDARNWDQEEHYLLKALQGTWPEGFSLVYEINHGVHDWTLLRKGLQQGDFIIR